MTLLHNSGYICVNIPVQNYEFFVSAYIGPDQPKGFNEYFTEQSFDSIGHFTQLTLNEFLQQSGVETLFIYNGSDELAEEAVSRGFSLV